MRSGGLRHRVMFRSEDKLTTISRRADIKGVKQSEALMEGEYAAEQTVRVRIRHDAATAAISPRWTMAHNSKNYEVNSSLDMSGRRHDLVILATLRQ